MRARGRFRRVRRFWHGRIRGLRRSYSGALHVRGHVGATQAANSRNVHEEARQLPSRLAALAQEIRRVLSAG